MSWLRAIEHACTQGRGDRDTNFFERNQTPLWSSRYFFTASTSSTKAASCCCKAGKFWIGSELHAEMECKSVVPDLAHMLDIVVVVLHPQDKDWSSAGSQHVCSSNNNQ
jgi:hypothetical protein